MTDILNINQCNIAQIIGETSRFMFHVILMHLTSCIVEGKTTYFGPELFKTLILTALSIAIYHIFFRKLYEPMIEKMKLICYDGTERVTRQKDIDKQYFIQSDIKKTKKKKRKI